MTLALTEKVRASIGGKAFRVFAVSGLSAGANTITPAQCALRFINWAEYTPSKATLSAGSTTLPVLNVAESSAGGTTITLSGIDTSADAGVLTVWGEV